MANKVAIRTEIRNGKTYRLPDEVSVRGTKVVINGTQYRRKEVGNDIDNALALSRKASQSFPGMAAGYTFGPSRGENLGKYVELSALTSGGGGYRLVNVLYDRSDKPVGYIRLANDKNRTDAWRSMDTFYVLLAESLNKGRFVPVSHTFTPASRIVGWD